MDIPIWFFGIVLFITIFAPIVIVNIGESMNIQPETEIELNPDFENFINTIEDFPLIGALFVFFKHILFDRIFIMAQFFPTSIAYYVFSFFGILNLLCIVGIIVLIRRVFGFS